MTRQRFLFPLEVNYSCGSRFKNFSNYIFPLNQQYHQVKQKKIIFVLAEIHIKSKKTLQQCSLCLIPQIYTVCTVACSRLRDDGGKLFSNKKCEKRAGAAAATAPFPKSCASYFCFARFNTFPLYYLRAWHRHLYCSISTFFMHLNHYRVLAILPNQLVRYQENYPSENVMTLFNCSKVSNSKFSLYQNSDHYFS